MPSYDGYAKYNAAIAENYERDRGEEEHWGKEQDFISKFFTQNSVGRVLDLPVGTGRFLEYYGGAQSVTGLDISEHMLDMSRRRARDMQLPSLVLDKGDVANLAFSDRTFDTVVCFRLLHLLPAPMVKTAMRELGRVCKGKLLLQIYAAPEHRPFERLRSLVRRLFKPLRNLVARGSTPWSHIESYSHSRSFVVRAAQDAGLSLKETHNLCVYHGTNVEVLELVRQ